MKPFFFILSFFLSTYLMSQKVNGFVLYQNSGGKAAEGVEISGFGCNTVYSQRNGMFVLPCKSKKPGQKLKLSIQGPDAMGKEIDLVNSDLLKYLMMPADPHQVFEFIVCPRGTRDENILKYYGISEKSTTQKLEQEFIKLKKLISDSEEDDKTIANLAEQLDQLSKNKKQVEDKLQEAATYMASINKDQASELVKNAMTVFEEEQDLKTALSLLSNDKLEESYQKVLENKQKSYNSIRKVIEGYELKIMLLTPRFEFDTIAVLYDKIIEIHEENNFNKEELADILLNAAKNQYENGKFQNAMAYQLKASQILENLEEKDPLLHGNAYTELGLSYYEIGEYTPADENHQRAIQILVDSGDTLSMEIAEAYTNQALVFMELGKKEEALSLFEKTLNIEMLQDSLDQAAIAKSYHNISYAYDGLRQYEEAIEYESKCIDLAEKVLEPDDPDLATYYSGMSGLYMDTKDYSNAEKYQFKAINIREKVLSPRHKSLALSYNRWAIIKRNLGETDEALKFYLKAIQIAEASLSEDHPNLAAYYNNLGVYYRSLKNYAEALKYQMKALASWEANPNTREGIIAAGYNSIGKTLYESGNYEEAAKYQGKSVDIRMTIYEKDNSRLVTSRLGYCLTLGKIGRFDEAFSILDDMDRIFPDNPIVYAHRVIIHGCKSDIKEARKTLKKSIEYGLTGIDNLMEDPCSDILKGDEEFMTIVNSMNKSE